MDEGHGAPPNASHRCPSDNDSHGLGINLPLSPTPRPAIPPIPRTPVGGRRATTTSSSAPRTPDWPLASPPSGALTGSTRVGFEDVEMEGLMPADTNTAHRSKVSLSSDMSRPTRSLAPTLGDDYDALISNHYCTSSSHYRRGMNNWLALGILLLSVFSTAFSGIFLAIGLHAPRYGRMIGTDGSITVANAAFLTSFFAKMIELSFVTVVVTFLGQCLARRASPRNRNGSVTLAEMSMRAWISQPGTMMTHWETVRYAGHTWLGILAVIATLMATLYTSASTALVQPQLKFSSWEKRVLQGAVKTSFANVVYLQDNCKTPITLASKLEDTAEDSQNTCLSIEHASQAYHNYQRYMSDWAIIAGSGQGTSDLTTRPKGWAIFNDNTTITAPWINVQNVTEHNGWVINNITMAFPHPGVIQAAQGPANGIMQPTELNGLGLYSIRASVPSPFINVLCVANINEEQLQPLVYDLWPNSSTVDMSTWPNQLGYMELEDTSLFDDIFEWGSKYGWSAWPPVFPMLPPDYNTVTNDTTGLTVYGRNAIYILGKGPPTTANYTLCEMRVGQTPQWCTQYNASANVATLEAICDDPKDDMTYANSQLTAPLGRDTYSSDWPNIAGMWARSVNLNTGTLQANSSNSRLWSELISPITQPDWQGNYTLTTSLPSPAEALAVMAGCTLLQSAQDAPFVEFYNYSGYNTLTDPQTQYFNASVHQQQYASGGTSNYERAFHIVLFAVFLINLMILLYWLWHRAWYMDFSDPANLFALAINSLPSEKLAHASCGNDLKNGERFKQQFRLDQHGGHVFMSSPDPSKNVDDDDSEGEDGGTSGSRREGLRRSSRRRLRWWLLRRSPKLQHGFGRRGASIDCVLGVRYMEAVC